MQAGMGGEAIETAANIAASAKSGLDKTMAVIEEKNNYENGFEQVEKMTGTGNATAYEMATQRKEMRINLAELNKQEAYQQNAAAAAEGTLNYTAIGNTRAAAPSHDQSSGSLHQN
ncbi:hypothetical protein LguiB_004453 [Lonicera macranthoides]